MNVPNVVIVPVPVFVKRPDKEESTAKDTDVTDPDPAEGLTQTSDVPFEERYCPDVPTVDKPVPPEDVPNGVEIVKPPAPIETGPEGFINSNGVVVLKLILKKLVAFTLSV